MGKGRLSFRKNSKRRLKKPPNQSPPPGVPALSTPSSPPPLVNSLVASGVKGKKKGGGPATRLWMRFDIFGNSELVECDRSAIIKRAGIPARDLRILGPVFSQSSNILAREKAMVVNLEFARAIITADEVLILDPLRQEVILFVDRLRQLLTARYPSTNQAEENGDAHDTDICIHASGKWLSAGKVAEGLQSELPFEFRVLETALETVCSHLDFKVAELEKGAYPVLDELARSVSTKNLEHVRSLKSNLTRLLARVQKVRDEIEHLLDDDEDMADLYLTRKRLQNQQMENAQTTNSIASLSLSLPRIDSIHSASQLTGSVRDKYDVEDLEMLLESYFMQLDGTRNKILSVREYIDDTEDYVNIQLDNQRNELIQLQLTLTIASFALAIETLISGILGMNLPCFLYKINGIFGYFVGGTSAACFFLFLLIIGYARRKKLLGS